MLTVPDIDRFHKSVVQIDASKSDDEIREEIRPHLEQQLEIIEDSLARRWVLCKQCGAVETKDNFAFYGGAHEYNLGMCNKCNRARS